MKGRYCRSGGEGARPAAGTGPVLSSQRPERGGAGRQAEGCSQRSVLGLEGQAGRGVQSGGWGLVHWQGGGGGQGQRLVLGLEGQAGEDGGGATQQQ